MRFTTSTICGAIAVFSGGMLAAIEPCRIEVVERHSGWPVPMVELRTAHNVRLVSDNAGIIACDLPELLGRLSWFQVLGHGYEVPADGFGARGVKLTPQPGKTLRVEVDRTSIAKRLGRLTGAGLFAESQKLGEARDANESGVVGCDSVQCVPYQDRLFWLWGDTTLPSYFLGLFHVSGATTSRQPLDKFTPPVQLDFDHFRDDTGRPRNIALMPGEGPTWLVGTTVLPDNDGKPRLVSTYMKIQPPLEVYRWGLCAWNDDAQKFEHVRDLWTRSDASPEPPTVPEGHAVRWKDPGGNDWILFGNPFPNLRCPANYEAWQNPRRWEILAPPLHLRSAADHSKVRPHSGSIAWHPWRKRWVTVFMESQGRPSALGELWYAEADSPIGPWGPAVKVLSHDNYTFYNPRLHVELSQADSPILLFEGTYTAQFADHLPPTPRYDYNQILYRIDLDDPALAPAQRTKDD